MIKTLSSECWENHPSSENNLVCEMSVDFLMKISHPTQYNINLKSRITRWDSGKPAVELFHYSDLEAWKDVIRYGLKEPLILIIEYSKKTVSLDFGSHLLGNADKDGYTHLPISLFVVENNEDKLAYFASDYVSDMINWDSIERRTYKYQVDPRDFFMKHLINC